MNTRIRQISKHPLTVSVQGSTSADFTIEQNKPYVSGSDGNYALLDDEFSKECVMSHFENTYTHNKWCDQHGLSGEKWM
jgi:hypothetical protein